jgi:hypothetical protein
MRPIVATSASGKAPDDLAFTAARGGVLRYRVARASWFGAAVKQAGCPEDFHPHALRHTAVSLAISAGADDKAVRRMLAHASVAMTLDTYADLFADDLEDIAMHLDRAASLESGHADDLAARRLRHGPSIWTRLVDCNGATASAVMSGRVVRPWR